MHRISITALALALGLLAAPRAEAQNRSVFVCQDGTVVNNAGLRTCAGRGGVNTSATARAQQGRVVNRGASNGGIQCPDGTWSTSGIHGCRSQDGRVYGDPRRSRTDDTIYGRRSNRRDNDDQDDDDDEDDDNDHGNDGRGHKAKHGNHGRHRGQWSRGQHEHGNNNQDEDDDDNKEQR